MLALCNPIQGTQPRVPKCVRACSAHDSKRSTKEDVAASL